jgi:hypothetical protein
MKHSNFANGASSIRVALIQCPSLAGQQHHYEVFTYVLRLAYDILHQIPAANRNACGSSYKVPVIVQL